MADETGLPEPEPTMPSGPTPGEAWDDVVARLSGLGDAVTRWAKAAANEPDTKQKLDQVRVGIDEIGQKADAALGRAVRSDLGHQVREGAEQAGQAMSDAVQQVSQAAGPHLKNVFSEISDIFGKAAVRVDEATRSQSDSPPPAAPPVPAEDKPSAPGEE